MSNGTCAGCGAEAKNKYCSRSCYNANRPKVSDQPSRNDCEVCGEAIRPKPGKRFCSRICKRRSVNGFRPKAIQCAECGATVEAVGTGNANRKYCGRSCSARHKNRQRMAALPPIRLREAQRKLSRAEQGTKGPHPWISGDCLNCGALFTTKSVGGRYPVSYCSLRCTQKASRDRRRARLRTPVGTPSRIPTPTPPAHRAKVYERDSYICHICNEPTLPEFTHTLGTKHPHPLAPTIDHVIPVSLGGMHTMDNVRCAHYECNIIKGAILYEVA